MRRGSPTIRARVGGAAGIAASRAAPDDDRTVDQDRMRHHEIDQFVVRPFGGVRRRGIGRVFLRRILARCCRPSVHASAPATRRKIPPAAASVRSWRGHDKRPAPDLRTRRAVRTPAVATRRFSGWGGTARCTTRTGVTAASFWPALRAWQTRGPEQAPGARAGGARNWRTPQEHQQTEGRPSPSTICMKGGSISPNQGITSPDDIFPARHNASHPPYPKVSLCR